MVMRGVVTRDNGSSIDSSGQKFKPSEKPFIKKWWSRHEVIYHALKILTPLDPHNFNYFFLKGRKKYRRSLDIQK